MAAHRRPGAVLTRWLPIIAVVTTATAGAQSPSPGMRFDGLSSAQQRVLGAGGRDGYDSWSAPSREAFERLTRALAALVLSDPENGEVLGSGLDLVESLGQPARAHANSSPIDTWRATVDLAPGARDALRRSAEFTLEPGAAGGAPVYVHRGAAAIRIAITGPAAAVIDIDIDP